MGLLRCFFWWYCSSLKALPMITLALAPATNHCARVLPDLIDLELELLRSRPSKCTVTFLRDRLFRVRSSRKSAFDMATVPGRPAARTKTS